LSNNILPFFDWVHKHKYDRYDLFIKALEERIHKKALGYIEKACDKNVEKDMKSKPIKPKNKPKKIKRKRKTQKYTNRLKYKI
jgi:hypothetical protein